MKRFCALINLLPLAIAVTLILYGVMSLSQVKPETMVRVLQTPDVPQSLSLNLVPGSIYDGDTLRVTDGRAETKIRLCGIDAPEKEQPMGIEARNHLRSLVELGDGSVIVVPVERDRYGRMVAELFVKPRKPSQPEEEISLNGQMVADGFAYHYAKYSGGCPNGALLARIEAGAIRAKRGVWRNPGGVKPWDYRKLER